MSLRWGLGGLVLGGLLGLVLVGVEHGRLQVEIADIERQSLELERQLASREDRRREVAELRAASSRLRQTLDLIKALKRDQVDVTELDRLLREAAAKASVDLRSVEWNGREIRITVKARSIEGLARLAEECVSRVGLEECRVEHGDGSPEGDSFVIRGIWSGAEEDARGPQSGVPGW
jgi:Tfp pilus assembly protein PilN